MVGKHGSKGLLSIFEMRDIGGRLASVMDADDVRWNIRADRAL